jgi:hypothetical protein
MAGIVQIQPRNTAGGRRWAGKAEKIAFPDQPGRNLQRIENPTSAELPGMLK